jgi:hypothetical protein
MKRGRVGHRAAALGVLLCPDIFFGTEFTRQYALWFAVYAIRQRSWLPVILMFACCIVFKLTSITYKATLLSGRFEAKSTDLWQA